MATELTLGEVQHEAHPVAYTRISVEHLNIHSVFGYFAEKGICHSEQSCRRSAHHTKCGRVMCHSLSSLPGSQRAWSVRTSVAAIPCMGASIKFVWLQPCNVASHTHFQIEPRLFCELHCKHTHMQTCTLRLTVAGTTVSSAVMMSMLRANTAPGVPSFKPSETAFVFWRWSA